MKSYFSRLFSGRKGDERLPNESSHVAGAESDDWSEGTILLNEFVVEREISEGGTS